MGQQTASVSKTAIWAGYILSALPVMALLLSGIMKLAEGAPVVKGFAELGWDVNLALPLGILEIACVIIYLIPRTAVLGAILITGYFGGAIATHVRVHDQFFGPAILGVLVWGGLWLRCKRVRALIPLRS